MTKDFYESFDDLLRTSSKRWFLLRHGHSEANQQHRIATRPENASAAFGLTQRGREEVQVSVQAFHEQLSKQGQPHLISSPLLRTRETADIAGRVLDVIPVVDARLRERNFGDLELLPDSHYEKVWRADAERPKDVAWNVETVYEVMDRVVQLVREVEETPEVDTCVLVTHCDVAMVLTCAFLKIDPRHHRTLDPIKTGEIRRLERVSKASRS